MSKKIEIPSNGKRVGGHIEIHISITSVPRRLAEVIYDLTHKNQKLKKDVSIFVAGGSSVDKKLEQVNKSVSKKAKSSRNY